MKNFNSNTNPGKTSFPILIRKWYRISAILIAGISIFFVQCQSNNHELDRQAIAPPFEDIQINGTTDRFLASDGGTFTKETGTTISVPGNAFETEDGTPYNGEVVLSFDEYHSPAEIIASGIPMHYEGPDGSGTLTSAGMFTILFHSTEGDALNLKKGKDVDINLASNVSDPDYNFYVLDPVTEPVDPIQAASILQIQALSLSSSNPIAGRWRMLSRAPKPADNPEWTNNEEQLEALPEEPVKPEELTDDAYKFEIDANLKNYPELADFKGIIWQYNGDENPKTDPNQNEWINNHPWTDIKITRKRGGRFFIELFSSKKKFKTPVKPVFSKVDMKNAEVAFESMMKNYESTRKKKVTLLKRKGALKKFARALSVSAPGTYNCDVLPRLQASEVELNSNFKFEGTTKTPKALYVVSKLTGEGRFVAMKYDADTESFVASTMCSTILLAVFPDGKVATCDQQSVKEAMQHQADGSNQYEFKFTQSNQVIKRASQLDDIIHSLI